jgi:adenylate cyclase class IV
LGDFVEVEIVGEKAAKGRVMEVLEELTSEYELIDKTYLEMILEKEKR